MLSIAVVYYLRLGVDSKVPNNNFRKKFISRFQSRCGKGMDIEAVLQSAMCYIAEQTDLGPRIANTRGLQENIFMVFVCNIAKIPLMITVRQDHRRQYQ
jgi:hypothetical protein